MTKQESNSINKLTQTHGCEIHINSKGSNDMTDLQIKLCSSLVGPNASNC